MPPSRPRPRVSVPSGSLSREKVWSTFPVASTLSRHRVHAPVARSGHGKSANPPRAQQKIAAGEGGAGGLGARGVGGPGVGRSEDVGRVTCDAPGVWADGGPGWERGAGGGR
jgi:hypothetical protein